MNLKAFANSCRRGVTLVELVVVITVTGIITIPIIGTMGHIVTAEQASMALAQSSRDLEPLTIAFQQLVRETSTDTLAAPNNFAFVVRTVNTTDDTLDCYTTPDPYNTGTYTLLGTIWYDAPNREIRIQRVWPSTTASWVAGWDITTCTFNLGPSATAGGGYAGMTMDHGRSVLMEVTIDTGRPYVHSVIAFSPNVR